MKIPYGVDISPEDGADSVERQGDHKDSPYFSRLDFYNMKFTDTLIGRQMWCWYLRARQMTDDNERSLIQ